MPAALAARIPRDDGDPGAPFLGGIAIAPDLAVRQVVAGTPGIKPCAQIAARELRGFAGDLLAKTAAATTTLLPRRSVRPSSYGGVR
jgi:hypothetical protein